MNSVVAELAKTFGKALVTGLGVELARRVSNRVAPPRPRPRDDDHAEKPAAESTVESLRRENQALREEVERLRRDGGQP